MLVKIAIAVVVIAVIAGFVYNYRRSKAINENGIETDAVLSRIEEKEGQDADGNRTVDYVYYVKYKNEAGETVEARLGNPPHFIIEGTPLRVKYLPEKPKYVLMVEKA